MAVAMPSGILKFAYSGVGSASLFWTWEEGWEVTMEIEAGFKEIC